MPQSINYYGSITAWQIGLNTPGLGEGLEGETTCTLVSALRNVSENR
jgi:hypothetical protein